MAGYSTPSSSAAGSSTPPFTLESTFRVSLEAVPDEAGCKTQAPPLSGPAHGPVSAGGEENGARLPVSRCVIIPREERTLLPPETAA